MVKPPDPPDLETLAARLAELEARLGAQERAAYTVKEFSRLHAISVSTYHKLQKEGRGPRVMWPGAQARISKEAAAEWRKKMASEAMSVRAKLARARRVKAAKVAAQSPNHGGQKRKRRSNAQAT
jgi:hypothetical protein